MALPQELWNKIDQIGIIGRDADKVINSMRMIFGLEPTKRVSSDPSRTDAFYRGHPRTLGADIVFYRIGDIDLEIICPKEGMSLHHEYLAKHGEGLYHIRFNVKSYDEAVKAFGNSGYVPAMHGVSLIDPRMRWAYFDTEPQLGYYTEIINQREVESAETIES